MMNWFDTAKSRTITNNRVFLSSSHRQIISILQNNQELLANAKKALRSAVYNKNHPLMSEARGLLDVVDRSLKRIGYSLANSSNEALKGGSLEKSNKMLADILEDKIRDSSGRIVPTAYAILADRSVWGEIPASSWVQSLKTNVAMVYDLLKEDDKPKSSNVLEALKSPVSTFGAGIGSSAATALLGGFSPIAIGLGKLAYQMWDKSNRRMYGTDVSKLSGNLSSRGSGSVSSSYGGNTSGFGSIGGSGVGTIGLYDFFNTQAYKAKWTKEVLENLRRISGGSSSGGFNLGGGIVDLISKGVRLALVGSAAFAGWKVGRFIATNFVIGGKTLEKHLDAFFGNAYNKIFRSGQRGSISATGVGTIADALQSQGFEQSEAIKKAKDLYYWEMAYKLKNKVDASKVNPRVTIATELQKQGMSIPDSVKMANDIYSYTKEAFAVGLPNTNVTQSSYTQKIMAEFIKKLDSLSYKGQVSSATPLNIPKTDSKSTGDPHLDYINMGMMGMK